MKTLLLAVVLAVAAAQNHLPPVNLCANPPPEQTKSLSDKISLPELYKITGSITDWKGMTTWLLKEIGTHEYRLFERQTGDKPADRWIRNFTDTRKPANPDYIFVNLTSGTCDSTASRPELFNIPRFKSIFGMEVSSINSLIQALVQFDQTHKGFVVKDSVDVVGGVNTEKYVACLDGPNATDSKVLLEVRYAGEDTIRPAIHSFSNPMVMSIRVVELETFNSTIPINHISVEIDRYEAPEVDKISELHIEHGVFCGPNNGSEHPLFLKPLDEYAAILDYYDHVENRSEVVEILYSKSRQVFIVAGDSFENGVRILGSSAAHFQNGTNYVLHDFKYGYEFTMNHDACESFATLTDATADVDNAQNRTLGMRKLEQLLSSPKTDSEAREFEWTEYARDVDMNGVSHRTFRAMDEINQKVVEAHISDDGEVESLSWYHYGTRRLALTLTISPIPIATSRLTRSAAQLANCYDEGDTEKFANNTWMVSIRDKSVADAQRVGLSRLNEAIVTAIQKSVQPAMIPYRIDASWIENRDAGLSLIIRIAEKTKIPSGAVAGYNFTSELSTVELFEKINATMLLEKMPFEVEKADGVKEEWMADAKTMTQHPQESGNGFIGYTGGAMFVLAIFCLLIGVSIGAVGVFVATRRQRISTLAYQVFE